MSNHVTPVGHGEPMSDQQPQTMASPHARLAFMQQIDASWHLAEAQRLLASATDYRGNPDPSEDGIALLTAAGVHAQIAQVKDQQRTHTLLNELLAASLA